MQPRPLNNGSRDIFELFARKIDRQSVGAVEKWDLNTDLFLSREAMFGIYYSFS